jgi:hypothetical protein
MSTSLRALVAFVLCGSSLQGCIAANLGKYCEGSGLDKADTSSLGLVLGAPKHRFAESPSFVLYSPSQAAPNSELQFALTPASLPWPADLDETPCQGLDWRTFRAEVQLDQWSRFMSLPRPLLIEGRIGVTDSAAPLRMSEFGFAILDVASGKTLMSCGCYWT